MGHHIPSCTGMCILGMAEASSLPCSQWTAHPGRGYFASKGVTSEERRALRSVCLQVRPLNGNGYRYLTAVVPSIHPSS